MCIFFVVVVIVFIDVFFFFQAEDGIRDLIVTGVQTCALPIYSPLEAINDKNVERLGFAWDYKLGTKRGLEATPVVVDGVMYAAGNWGRVYALDATTGRELWTYNPGVEGQSGRYACCDVVNRGLAVWKGRVYVA